VIRDLYLTTTLTADNTPMPSAGFEPTLAALEQPQTYVFRPRGHWDRQFS